MLNVAETPVPVLSVPVVAAGSWMKDLAPKPAAVPAPPRFQSEDEEPEEDRMEASEPVFFAASSAANGVAAAKAVAEPAARHEVDLVSDPNRPRFQELAEEPVFTPLPRDYANNFAGARASTAPIAEDQRAHAATAVFTDAEEEAARDLDVPAFMRRTHF